MLAAVWQPTSTSSRSPRMAQRNSGLRACGLWASGSTRSPRCSLPRDAGDDAALELLREVGTLEEAAVIDHDGRIVKRLGDGLMATFLTAQEAVAAALDCQEALRAVEVAGHRPQMRAGVHWGRPRKLGG